MTNRPTPFLVERTAARLRPGAYYRSCNHCGGEFASSFRYLSHCRDQARAAGHGIPGTACPDIMTCPWVNLNVAPDEYRADS